MDVVRADVFDGVAPLGPADIAGAMRLSISAGWNQNESDWRTMLELGQGWGIRTRQVDGTPVLAASIVVLPYAGFGWVSMVLVLPEHRGAGLAKRLLQQATAHLAQRGLTPILDATPAGHAVYLGQGFRDTWGFARYQRDAASDGPGDAAGDEGPSSPRTRVVRPLNDDDDWPALASMDVLAFGASRLPLLRALARRLPAAAHVATDPGGRLLGYVLARDGRQASQIGPLLASDPGVAKALFDAALGALSGSVFVDLCDRQHELLPWLQARGFRFQRPFTRMLHDPSGRVTSAPGDPARIVLVAGPELG